MGCGVLEVGGCSAEGIKVGLQGGGIGRDEGKKREDFASRKQRADRRLSSLSRFNNAKQAKIETIAGFAGNDCEAAGYPGFEQDSDGYEALIRRKAFDSTRELFTSMGNTGT